MTTIHKSAAVGKSEAAIAIDFETCDEARPLTVATWARQCGRTKVLDALRETLRADYHPLARLFLMLADEGLIPPIPNGEPWVIAFHPRPYQLEAMRQLEQVERFYAFSAFGRMDMLWHHMETNTGRLTHEGPALQDLPKSWQITHREKIADAFPALLVPRKLFVDEVARIVAPKNKPWYQKFDKKRRY